MFGFRSLYVDGVSVDAIFGGLILVWIVILRYSYCFIKK